MTKFITVIFTLAIFVPVMGNDIPSPQPEWKKLATSIGSGIATGVGCGFVTFYITKHYTREMLAVSLNNSFSEIEKKVIQKSLLFDGLIYDSFNWGTFWMARRIVVDNYESKYQWLSFCVSMLSYFLTQVALNEKNYGQSF